jgi:hypothetical protein
MNPELKGRQGIQECWKLAEVFEAHEIFLGALVRGEQFSLTELANFLSPGGLLEVWTALTPKQRQAFFSWVLRKSLRVTEVTLMPSGHKVRVTLQSPFFYRVIATEIIRTFARAGNRGGLKAVYELKDNLHFHAEMWVDHHFV